MSFLSKRGTAWYLCWTQDGKKHSRSLKTNRKTLAEQYLVRLELQLARRELGQAVDISLDKLSEEYLSYSKATKKQSTLDRHDRPRVTRFIEFLKGQGLQKPAEIRLSHIQAYQQTLLETLKPVTLRHCMFAVSGLLGFALQRGYVQSNMARNVVKPKAVRDPPRFLSFDEWEKVRKIAEQPPPLAARRHGILCRVPQQRASVPRLAGDRFRSGRDHHGQQEGFTLKNREPRTVPLNAQLKAVLKPLRRDQGYCFKNAHGRQWEDKELSSEFRRQIAGPSDCPTSAFTHSGTLSPVTW
jgi:integrase